MYDFAQVLRVVIKRKDASSEPLDMIPAELAATRCRNEYPTKDYSGVEPAKKVCESREVQRFIERARQEESANEKGASNEAEGAAQAAIRAAQAAADAAMGASVNAAEPAVATPK
jgi:regulator of protease activity HflC (stomatin/prohibitin superfamily)